jgi:hypothetical protein
MVLEGERETGVCRASMLYIYLGNGSRLSLRVGARCSATGFLEL